MGLNELIGEITLIQSPCTILKMVSCGLFMGMWCIRLCKSLTRTNSSLDLVSVLRTVKSQNSQRYLPRKYPNSSLHLICIHFFFSTERGGQGAEWLHSCEACWRSHGYGCSALLEICEWALAMQVLTWLPEGQWSERAKNRAGENREGVGRRGGGA